MSSREQSLESFRDDGAGQIPCPKKGLMAIQRCREWQRDTEQAGATCTCSVFLNYGKTEPRGAGEMSPERQLCGSQFDVAATQLRARIKQESRQPRDATEADATEADATEADATEEEAMATRPKTGSICNECKKSAPDGTKIRGGLCKPCRDKAADEGARRDRAAKIRERAQTPPPAAPLPTKPLEMGRQQALSPVLADENARLLKELKRAEKSLSLIDFVYWALEGVERGFIKDLGKVLIERFKPRFKGTEAIATVGQAAKD